MRVSKAGVSLYLKGLCMGLADIVPGISGGTVAFVLGFYTDLLTHICFFNQHLIAGRFREAFSSKAFRFLLTLLLGIASAFIVFSKLLGILLNDPVYRTYLYSLFFGLIGAASIVCARQITNWNVRCLLLAFFGGVAGWLLTGAAPPTQLHYEPQIVDSWLIACGALAVGALLLPGISGSYVLTILGAYAIVLFALDDFILGLQMGGVDSRAFLILFNTGCGILIGGMLFSYAIRQVLERYHDYTVALMTGFMVGAMRALWPFWMSVYTLHPVHPERGLQLLAVEPFIPAWQTPIVFQAAAVMFLGFALVLVLDAMASTRKTPSTKLNSI